MSSTPSAPTCRHLRVGLPVHRVGAVTAVIASEALSGCFWKGEAAAVVLLSSHSCRLLFGRRRKSEAVV